MLYLISDIHGELDNFKQLLKKIKFDREKDNIIIMGDILDRGSDGVALLEYIKPYILDNSMELMMRYIFSKELGGYKRCFMK